MPTDREDPAFPMVFPFESSQRAEWGMTKREEFAKAAMQGILANHDCGLAWSSHDIAEHAISCADALIRQLNE